MSVHRCDVAQSSACHEQVWLKFKLLSMQPIRWSLCILHIYNILSMVKFVIITYAAYQVESVHPPQIQLHFFIERHLTQVYSYSYSITI